MKAILNFILLIVWVFGFVIAKGFWSTALCFVPLWSWYLVAEYAFLHLKVC